MDENGSMNRKSIVLMMTVVIQLALISSAAPIVFKKFDTNHSTIGFHVPILGGMSEVTGKFTEFTAELTYDESYLAASHVTVTIHAASVDTGIADRDKHLRTKDFFDVERFPDITFQSSAIRKASDGFVAHGTLTMHGVSKEIDLPFRVTGTMRNAEKKTIEIGIATQAHLNRQDYGVAWKHPAEPTFVGDDVTVDIHLLTKVTPVEAPPG